MLWGTSLSLEVGLALLRLPSCAAVASSSLAPAQPKESTAGDSAGAISLLQWRREFRKKLSALSYQVLEFTMPYEKS